MDKKEFINVMFSEKEIEFEYKGINYIISKAKHKFTFYSTNSYDIKVYDTPKELLESINIDGKYLLDIIEDITNIKVI